MTTKAKCFALANENGLTISYGFSSYCKEASVDLPDGFLLPSTGSTGLCFETYECSAKDFWKAVYGDVQTIVAEKNKWLKVSYSDEVVA
jgi:hypothetical protein